MPEDYGSGMCGCASLVFALICLQLCVIGIFSPFLLQFIAVILASLILYTALSLAHRFRQKDRTNRE